MGNLNFTQEQYELIFAAVRKYQHHHRDDNNTWKDCEYILDELYQVVYSEVV